MNAPVLGDLFAAAMEGLAERYPDRDVTLRTALLVLDVEDGESTQVLVQRDG